MDCWLKRLPITLVGDHGRYSHNPTDFSLKDLEGLSTDPISISIP